MEATVLIVKILGVYFIVSGLFIITQQRSLGIILRDLFAHRALTYILGILMVFGGSGLIFSHQAGTDSLSTFVVVMGWAILLKGLLYVFLPDVLRKAVKDMSAPTYRLLGLLVAAIGVHLVFFFQ